MSMKSGQWLDYELEQEGYTIHYGRLLDTSVITCSSHLIHFLSSGGLSEAEDEFDVQPNFDHQVPDEDGGAGVVDEPLRCCCSFCHSSFSAKWFSSARLSLSSNSNFSRTATFSRAAWSSFVLCCSLSRLFCPMA
jgi:hypothetical protein